MHCDGDGGSIVAVRPRQPFVRYFKTMQRTPRRQVAVAQMLCETCLLGMRSPGVVTVRFGVIGAILMAVALVVSWEKGQKILQLSSWSDFRNSFSFALEPALLVIFVVTLLIVPMSSTLRGGLLVGVGAAEILYFAGFVISPLVVPSSPPLRLGGAIGLIGAVLVTLAGALELRLELRGGESVAVAPIDWGLR